MAVRLPVGGGIMTREDRIVAYIVRLRALSDADLVDHHERISIQFAQSTDTVARDSAEMMRLISAEILGRMKR